MAVLRVGWWAWELPPRARRIRAVGDSLTAAHGTTSACAENTLWFDKPQAGEGNYLRVRGEYVSTTSHSPVAWELPPRARRIPSNKYTNKTKQGTTSACAENTPKALGQQK